jgi:hypothetical protein
VTAGAEGGDTGIAHGALLIEFAEAVLGDDERRLARAQAAVHDAMGEAALVDAAGIVGFFNAIDRIADATGTPLDEATLLQTDAMRDELGINEFAVIKETLDHG